MNLFKPERFVILDGAMGTQLLAAGLGPGQRPEAFMLAHPEAITAIHRAYIEAGADIVYANTFGANAHKLAGSGLGVEEVISAAIACARKAAASTGAKVALDVGPLGELLEPVGLVTFEEAVETFGGVMRAGAAAGADLIVIETMTDLYEAKAALLAAVEETKLPVMVSMTFEESGRTFSGASIEAMAATLEGLGAAALGINCSLGPAAVMPLAQRLCKATALPVFIKPNAGMPDPATGAYTLTDGDFAEQMRPCLELGVSMVGGCCGTTPATIHTLASAFSGAVPAKGEIELPGRVCSASRVATVGDLWVVGERINPTGKKQMKEGLAAGDLSLLQRLAVEQQQAGATLLDINVGAPGIDEVEMLPRAVKAVQAVCDLPLQLDSANPKALAAALRVTNGKPMVNSTSGEARKLERVLPLCRRYGAAVIGLALDEGGIPETAEGRLAVARRIRDAALEAGIPARDVFIDCLVLAASAEPAAALTTVEALRLVKQELGLATLAGVSNVSFGLPQRGLLNRTFLAMALAAGADVVIINPGDTEMMAVVAAGRLYTGRDVEARDFLARFAQRDEAPPPAAGAPPDLRRAIADGLEGEAQKAAKALLAEGNGPMDLIEGHIMPALDEVGGGFEQGTVFLPQLLASAGAAQGAFEVIRAGMDGAATDGPPVVLATVQGDIHDIGKNIVKVLLQNYGFTVRDLGRDVPPEAVAEAVRASGAKLVGLSALMTTTLPAMERTIALLQSERLDCQVMVGGAVLTPDFARSIGADHYAKDAQRGVALAREVYGV